MPEDSAVGTSVIRVVAEDRDSGDSRIVTYAFQKVNKNKGRQTEKKNVFINVFINV